MHTLHGGLPQGEDVNPLMLNGFPMGLAEEPEI
jgi:hypothetical protein